MSKEIIENRLDSLTINQMLTTISEVSVAISMFKKIDPDGIDPNNKGLKEIQDKISNSKVFKEALAFLGASEL
jgi:hypothetical protein